MTDKQILRAHNMGRLFFGPYRAPAVRYGQELLCAVHGLSVVEGEHGPMGWPRVKLRGHPRLIVCGDLLRALEDETADAVALHWGISVACVSRWRGVLKLPRMSRAGSLVKAAQMRAKRQERPDLHVEPGAATVASLSPRTRQEHGKASAGDRAWTKAEIALLAKHTNREVAALTGRTYSAVGTERNRAGVPAPVYPHTCRFCGYRWESWSSKPPIKCASEPCRRRNWS